MTTTAKVKTSATVTGMLSQRCRQCGVRVGQWCLITGTHEKTRSLHMIRYRDWVEALGVTAADVSHHVDEGAE